VGDRPRVHVDVGAACKAEKEKEWRELLGRLNDGWIFRGEIVVYLFIQEKLGKTFFSHYD
jgi:hypothetical protein